MAKTKTRNGNINMSAAVRDMLKENPKLTGKEVEAKVTTWSPGKKINSNSLNVARQLSLRRD